MKRALDALPSTLNENYKEAMKRIERSPNKLLAFKALIWIVYAVRPLRRRELLHAVAVDELEPADESVEEDCLTPMSTIVNACAGMIRIDNESDVVGLVHKTTQEYFDCNGIYHFPHAYRYITESCLRYLSLPVFRTGPCSSDEAFERRLTDNALLDYAVHNSGDHISQGFDYSLEHLALDLFLDERFTSSASQVLFVKTKQSWRGSTYTQDFPKRFQGIHFVAYFGLTDILRLLHATGQVDVDIKDEENGRTPLSWAAGRGHEAVVMLLLATSQVDVDTKGSHCGRTPLSWAAEEGHDAVVKLLLATGQVDVDTKDSGGQTPLSLAAGEEHEAVVKLLLATGQVDVDTKDSEGQTPLSWAAERGQEAVVKLLLATDQVDVDTKDSGGRTPLLWAAEGGHEAVVKLLLATDQVDVDTKDSGGQTPLSLAAGEEHEAVVKLLLATDQVDVNTKDSRGQTPLSCAAEGGHEIMVKLLLATG